MSAELFDDSEQLTPREAFLFAFDSAIRATVQTLTDVGLDEVSIWAAFSEALKLFHNSAVVVEGEAYRDRLFRGEGVRDVQRKSA